MDIEQCGERLVKINDVLIPAWNIQIDGFPCYKNGVWYNRYFEILIEGVGCWVVEEHSASKGSWCGCGRIVVEQYHNWFAGNHKNYYTKVCETWGDFVELYKMALLWAEAYAE